MTPFEHALIGIDGVLALGLHRRFEWKVAALAGVAAASPDWDGLSLLGGAALYDRAHRVWGHNLFACVFLGLGLGWLDYRFDLVTRAARFVSRRFRLTVADEHLQPRTRRQGREAAAWMLVAVLAALSHLPCDMVVSGTATHAHWPVQPFWPVHETGWVFPRVAWGDVGITLLFIAGAAAMIWRPTRIQRIATVTLIAVLTYVVVRPWLRI